MSSFGKKNNTVFFNKPKVEEKPDARIVLNEVYEALAEKGYNPKSQLVGYILSGDPTYITSYNDARTKLSKLERDLLLEELVDSYIKHNFEAK